MKKIIFNTFGKYFGNYFTMMQDPLFFTSHSNLLNVFAFQILSSNAVSPDILLGNRINAY